MVRVCSTTLLDDRHGLLVQRNVAHLAGFSFLDYDATLQSIFIGDRQQVADTQCHLQAEHPDVGVQGVTTSIQRQLVSDLFNFCCGFDCFD
ncbi:hypothetical protein D3C71_1816200 [compost metagenome]